MGAYNHSRETNHINMSPGEVPPHTTRLIFHEPQFMGSSGASVLIDVWGFLCIHLEKKSRWFGPTFGRRHSSLGRNRRTVGLLM